ncbi:hypothetical protein VNI00_015475 [Paramarasmius palmivorus]|uniref:G protein-coupled receptor n=1 Tax=Paramarasmius palmivorus TaxID=297713 RepID=A0AAW0BKP4_9AGAR
MLAVAETALIVGQLFQINSLMLQATNESATQDVAGTSPTGDIDLKACNIILYIGLQLIDLTAFIILLYRCYVIYNRNWKVIVGPALFIIADVGVYIAALPTFFELSWGSVQSVTSTKNRKMTTFSNVVTVLNTVTNGLLMALIAGRIWTIKRRMRQLIGRGAPTIQQKYNTVIAMTLESGLIIPVSLIVFDVFTQVDNQLAAGLVGSCLPQLIALAPLLILVRGGLGLTTKGSHITLQAGTTGHDVEQASPPMTVSVTVSRIRSVASSEAQTNGDVKPDEEYV